MFASFLLFQWTRDGDAFIIGSDLKRLESETLPQFFRHNRFQSLVRQLNFYSFRKVNKERNIWIYKHELFHRDFPGELHKVRRRTCPGLDGRKQRFNRYSTRRLNGEKSDDSSDESSVAEDMDLGSHRKREGDEMTKSLFSKRHRRLSNDSIPYKNVAVVDDSILMEDMEDTEAIGDLVHLSSSHLTVSEVSDRLEEYARKARGRIGGKVDRRSGVVTPPFDASSGGLVTYDDERNYDSDDMILGTRLPSLGLGVVTDYDDSTAGDEDSQIAKVTPPKTRKIHKAPVKDNSIALSISEQILDRVADDQRPAFVAPTTVARFCMSNSPYDDAGLCARILQLVASCEKLSSEFQLYRAALHPSNNRAVTMQQIWQREASRGDAVRDFKTFAVNCIQTLLGNAELAPEEKSTLERTADIWLKSVRASA